MRQSSCRTSRSVPTVRLPRFTVAPGSASAHGTSPRRRPVIRPLIGSPEGDATADTGLVGNDRGVRIGAKAELPRVAASDVEVVEVDEGPEVLDGLLDV